MKTIKIYSKQLQKQLGASGPINQQDYGNYKGYPIYCYNRNKATCVNELLDEMGTTDGYTLYYVIEDGLFYAIENFI